MERRLHLEDLEKSISMICYKNEVVDWGCLGQQSVACLICGTCLQTNQIHVNLGLWLRSGLLFTQCSNNRIIVKQVRAGEPRPHME
jgi:hypothetical protein